MSESEITKEQAQELAKEIYAANVEPGALSEIMKPEQYTNRPIWETDPDFLDPYKELPPLQTWCKIADRPALPKSGVITFSAKQKKGKSLSTYALAIPLLSGKDFDTLRPTATDPKDRPNLVMVFDMEMSETTLTNRVLNQVQSIGKEYGNRFVVCSLKSKSIQDRIKTITAKVEQYQPDIIVIDQAAKLVTNGNDLAESNSVTDWLDKMSIGRSVWVVMHENKGQDDNNMKGHLGSFLSYAAVEAYSVDRKDGVFTITYREGRDTDSDNAAPVRFAIGGDGKIIDAAAIFRAAQEREAEGWRNNFAMLFGEDKTLRSMELIERIKSKEGLEERAAKTKIARAKELGVIRKISNEPRAPYELTPIGA